MPDEEEAIQVVLIPSIRSAFEAWLESRGLELAGPLPVEEGDDGLPTYIVGIGDELAEAVFPGRAKS